MLINRRFKRRLFFMFVWHSNDRTSKILIHTWTRPRKKLNGEILYERIFGRIRSE